MAKERKAVVQRPLAEVIRMQWRDILLSALVRMSEQAPFSTPGRPVWCCTNLRYSGAGMGYQLASVLV